MKTAIISFLFLITLVAPIFFYITSLNIFDNSSKKNWNNNWNYTIQNAQTSSFKKEVSQLAKKSIQTIKDIKNKNDLPTIEETRKRIEWERQEEINRIAITFWTTPKEVEEMILPFPLDIESIKQETDKMVAEMNKNLEKAKIQTTQQQTQTPQRWDSFANINWTFVNRNELDKKPIPDSFSECLSTKSVIMYWTEWCKWCNEQKALFWKAFEKVWFIDCDKERKLCLDAWVRWFPSWIDQKGNQYPWIQSINKLSEISWCTIK